MNIVTDLEEIRRLAEQRRDDDYDFRSFLKCVTMPSEDVDDVFRSVYEEVRQHIDCNECANCCKAAVPDFMEYEMKRMAEALDMSPDDFVERYCTESEGLQDYTFPEKPCPMLEDNRCAVGDAAPDCCKDYPHLDKPFRAGSMISIIDRSAMCPIVFNVLERVQPIIRSKERDHLGDSYV